MFWTMFGFTKLKPSCCPDLIKKGLYTSIPLTYTKFSSKLPPLTLYCVLNSLLLLTPGKVIKMFSTPALAPITFLTIATSIFFKLVALFIFSLIIISFNFSVFELRVIDKRPPFLLFALYFFIKVL